MLISVIVNTVWWTPYLQQLLKTYIFGGAGDINWIGIAVPILGFGFAIWAIVELCMKLASKPIVYVKRALGSALLTDPRKTTNRSRFEYFCEIVIANGSPDKALSIVDIRLEIQYERTKAYWPPYVGVPESELNNAERGEIADHLNLGPGASKQGMLAFVEERDIRDGPIKGVPSRIFLKDSRGIKYWVPVTIERMQQDNIFEGKPNAKA